MSGLRVALLGIPRVERDGVPQAFDTRKALAILALVAATGRPQGRQRLADMFWPTADPDRARAALRRTLSAARRVMGEAMAAGRTAVDIDRARLSVDLFEFEAALEAGDPAGLRAAAALYRDDFCAGLAIRDSPEFDDWRSATAERLRLRLAGALERLVEGAVAAGDLTMALDHAERWLRLDPLHEPAHRAVIQVQGWAGERSAALRQYRALASLLQRELGVAPLPETTRLYEAVRTGRLDPPLPRSAAPAPSPSGRPAVPLVGRRAESDRLRDAWRAAAARTGLAALVGEGGAGKTRLLETLRDTVARARAPLLVVRGYEGERDLPYALLTDLLRAAFGGHPGLVEELPRPLLSELSRLLPQLAPGRAGPSPAPAPVSPAALPRLFSAAADAVLAALAPARAGGPAGLLAVEDLQWVDDRSLEALAYLLRRTLGAPVLVVLTWRPEEAGTMAGIPVQLRAAMAEGRGVWIEPPRLGVDSIAELAGALSVEDCDPDRVLGETQGLPLLVVEYLLAALEPSEPVPFPGPPPSVRELMGARLEAAGEPARQLLTAVAVLGTAVDAEILRAVSGRGEEEVAEGLDRAVHRGLLVERSEVPRAPVYDFPYAALRRVALDSATLARRRLLHGRAADALARRVDAETASTGAAAVAGHLEGAGRDREASAWWWRAAQRRRGLAAHSDALAALERALALGNPPGPTLAAIGDVLTALGRYPEAMARLESAAAAAEGQASTLAAIEHRLADLHHRQGDWALAEAHLRAARDLVAESDAAGRGRVDADLALVAVRRGHLDQARRSAGMSVAAAETAADDEALAQAHNVLGVLAARAGDLPDAERHLEASLRHGRRLADPGAAVAALNNRARTLAGAGRAAEALAAAEEALRLGIEHGDQHRVGALHTNLADLLHAQGRSDDALVHLKASARHLAAVDTGGVPRPEVWSLVEW